MNRAAAEARFADAQSARFATVGAHGEPHVVPVVFAVANGDIQLAVDQKPKTTRSLRRLANIAGNPHVSLLVDHYEDEWTQLWWVRVDGIARVRSADSAEGVAAIDALVAKYAQYAAARPLGPAIVVTDLQWHWWSATK